MIPDPFPFEEARRMFREPEVADTSATPAFKWSDPDVEGLKRRPLPPAPPHHHHHPLPLPLPLPHPHPLPLVAARRPGGLTSCARCTSCAPCSYLIDEKQFGEERVLKAIERLKKCKGKSGQNRMEDFFGKATIIPNKRKEAEAAKGKGKGKAGKGPLKKAKK